MLKKLKRKFVAIVTTLAGIVLAGVLAMSLYSTYVNQQGLIKDALDRNLEGSTEAVPVIGAARKSEAGTKRRTNMLALTVEISQSGVVLESSDDNVSINGPVLEKVVGQALEASSNHGSLPEYHVSWKSATTGSGTTRIAIVDTTAVDDTFHNAIVRNIEIIALGILVLLGISWKLADWALAPVQRAWDQQRRFVSDASHELKTPLAVILANTQILQRDKALPADTRRWVDSTAEEAGHMKTLVNDLLQLARADESVAGTADILKRTDVDLSEIVSSAALEFDAVAFERGTSVEDSVTEGVHVQGDADWLRRMVRILIDNAVKYAAVGTTVKVTLEQRSKGCRLTVNNQGPTIPAEDLPHVFERFYRSDKARTRDGGTGGFGLGLAIAKSTVDAHGGSIQCTSDEKSGTTFTVTL
ncbi:sensor histidine kinase [Parafannyhessea umbonata]|uniref:Sensor-like histidine kinase SenX3 n=1 Tax=Parafannyhessea umbonata TaxID=604330 RepID=A0A1G6L143_9ACTN|nr:HAMP domain-containing sensor histidine kinase [Parafannyhessea umbonata]MBM6988481.1 HAMP domain-containing histidine kinase [Parafannyhessea umbonata]SDC36867.1 Signal transduction histidine kinase [Parafannyhessea umbonata]